jgi:hypothetical protein
MFASACLAYLITYIHHINYFILRAGITYKTFQETLHTHKPDKKEDQENQPIIEHLAADSEESVEKNISSATTKDLFKNWPLMSSIILYCIVCFDDMAYSEVCFDLFEINSQI